MTLLFIYVKYTLKVHNFDNIGCFFLKQSWYFLVLRTLVGYGLPICSYHNFVNNGPFLTNLVPMKSPELDLRIGSMFVKNGPLLTKLCTHKIRNPFITFELLSELLVNHYLLRWVMSLCTAVVTIFYGGRESLCSIDQLSHYVLRVPRTVTYDEIKFART